MANQKSKKTAKKSSTKPEANKEAQTAKKDTKVVKSEVVTLAKDTSGKSQSALHGFFARKYDKDENILTIFKSSKIWGALIGELVGTMLLTLMMLIFGLIGLLQFQYIFTLAPVLICVYVGVYAAIVGLSGANLNPLVTVGMMATRRMSAIRGILYMLAQVVGAWLGLLLLNAFRLGAAATAVELPIMDEISGETFWAIALVELVGAIVLAFSFARARRYARRNVLTFAVIVACSVVLMLSFGTTITQGFFQQTMSVIFNPAIALMLQILPTSAAGFGELLAALGLAAAAYIIVPMVGGVIGFYLSDFATKLSRGGYVCEGDDEE